MPLKIGIYFVISKLALHPIGSPISIAYFNTQKTSKLIT